MRNQKENLQTLFEKTISRFPELRSKDVRVQWKSLGDALLEVQPLDPEGWIIEVDPSLQNATDAVIIGGIAHELAHILAERDWKKNTRLLDRILYIISKRYKTLDERNTDFEVILRGFGSELLAFMRESEEQGLDFYEEDGLSLREIKSLIKR